MMMTIMMMLVNISKANTCHTFVTLIRFIKDDDDDNDGDDEH